ncbi:MAG: glycosyltransferase family 10 [Akkermansiaceae bacterium]|nr:glycosyltransferase family 10 [Akkermansiaceae bacterium]
MPESTIRIKIITRGQDSRVWGRQLPASGSFTGECSFHYGQDVDRYDWLVVVDDVSRKLGSAPETLACPDEHTLLVTTEPPTITRYGKAFCAQFAHVLTSQPEEALPHPSRIHSHTGNLWFNGHSYSDLKDKELPEKSRSISTVCSSKQQKHTIHNDRYQFSHWLMEQIPDMDLYGHGAKFIKNKYDALDPYRYHLAIENHSGLHHWTEKLADPYLSGCFPIYYGCPNVRDYFPEESFLEIDIYKRQAALEKIRNLVDDDSHYSTRKEAIHEARRLVMEDYNLMSMIESIVLKHHSTHHKATKRKLYGRKQMRCRRPMDALGHIAWHINRHFK